MSELESRLEQVLNDPDAMGQIMALARSLGGSSAPSPPSAADAPPQPAAGGPDPAMLGRMAAMLNQADQGDDRRTALLQALRPFLKPDRCARLDQAIQLARLSRVARFALEMLRPEEESHV